MALKKFFFLLIIQEYVAYNIKIKFPVNQNNFFQPNYQFQKIHLEHKNYAVL